MRSTSRGMVLRPFSVLGSEDWALPSTEIRVWTIESRPASRSTSRQRSPTSSPRRGPRVSASRNNRYKRSLRTAARKRCASLADHVRISLRRHDGRRTLAAGLRARRPWRTAWSKTIRSTVRA